MKESKLNIYAQKRKSYLENVDLLIRESEAKSEYWVLQNRTKIKVSEFSAKLDGEGEISFVKKLELEKEKVNLDVAQLELRKNFVDILGDYTSLKLDISNPEVTTDQELDSIYVNGRTEILDKHERYKI